MAAKVFAVPQPIAVETKLPRPSSREGHRQVKSEIRGNARHNLALDLRPAGVIGSGGRSLWKLLVRVANGVVVFPHIAGYAGRECTGTLLIVCAAVSGDGVFAACNDTEASRLGNVPRNFETTDGAFAAQEGPFFTLAIILEVAHANIADLATLFYG
jgi:hypothetical protein